jgi:hypothetical protein
LYVSSKNLRITSGGGGKSGKVGGELGERKLGIVRGERGSNLAARLLTFNDNHSYYYINDNNYNNYYHYYNFLAKKRRNSVLRR